MKTNKYISILIAIVFSVAIQAQNVGINSTGVAPRNAAMLDILSSNTGLLIPTLALTNVTAYAPCTGTPVDGLLVYSSTNPTGGQGSGYYYWSTASSIWVNITDNLAPGNPWELSGNTLGAAGNFMGSIDAFDVVFKSTNTERMRILAGGNVGINNAAPTQALDVVGNVRFSGALMPNNLAGTTGQVLISQGAGTAPIWSTTGYSGQFSASYLSSTGAGQKFEVPSGVTTVTVELWGAGGGVGGGASYYSQGGAGAYAYGILTVTPLQVLTVIVGGSGPYNGLLSAYPDGGVGGGANTTYEGGGGGRSAIQIVPGTDVITAGGGGGGGGGGGSNGAGGGGGAGAFGGSGSAGLTANGGGGGGGGQAAGGTAGAGGASTAGAAYTSTGGGSGGTNGTNGGGGGGGGYYGGGGGGTNGTNKCGGGGGGSSWYNVGLVASPSSIAGSSGVAGGTLPVPAPNNANADYTGNAIYGPGAGGGFYNNLIYPGGPGEVVIHW